MDSISKHISFSEATRSNTANRLGIENKPNSDQLSRMELVAEKIFEPVRIHFNHPIYVSSFFRSAKINEEIKGSTTSQHLCNNGAAVDVVANVYGGMTNLDIFNYIKDNLKFDQLILEEVSKGNARWVHFSYVNSMKNRNQILLMYKQNGRTRYETYTEKRLNELLKNI